MKTQKLFSLILIVALFSVLIAACQPAAAPAAPAAEAPAAPAADEKLYIPVISKGFQHQFWIAVRERR
jgi:ribose transport system substrate-binding protein